MANPFDEIGGNDALTAPERNPYDDVGPSLGPQSSAIGAATRTAARSLIPAIGSFPAIGAGAELGAAAGAFGGPAAPITVPAGALVGGFAGALLGSTALSSAQNWALSKLPDSWREAIGMDDRQARIDQGEHPIASFLGGIAPYALTMRPGAAPTTALPENATALQRIMAHPATSRVFGGVAMGGMELGNEAASHEDLDWRKVAISTGFGLVFNRPTRMGEAITEVGARPTRSLLGRPTVAQAGDLKVAGPGVTESVFQGTQEQSPQAAMTAQDAARNEHELTAQSEPDLHGIARRMNPELFDRYDRLVQQRDQFRQWIDEYNNPPPEAFKDIEDRKAAVQQQLDEHVAARGGYQSGPEARRLRAQLRDLDAEHNELSERAQKFQAGQAEETPDLQMARQHLMATDYELRDLAPDVSAAYRRASDAAGAGTVEPAPHVAPEETEPTPTAPETAIEAGRAEQPTLAEAGRPEAKPIAEQKAAIAHDVTQQLVAAGRPQEEAEAAGQLIAARYATRAARFKGTLGTAEELYNREGAEIRGGRGAAATATTKPAPTLSPDGTMTPEALREFVKAGGKVEGAKELAQAAQGKIRLSEGRRPIITLMKDANASTFIHETGHQWLEEILRDAQHPQAPDILKDDADTVLQWLGAHSAEDVKTKHHEKFARGFEQYLREGVAPSPELAGVFAKFKQWLVQIYNTIKGLGKPINDDIRGVFDRLLAEEPKRTVIAPELEPAKSLADIHEADAAHTEPHEADAAMARIESEARRTEQEVPPEIANEVRAAAERTKPTGEGGVGAGEQGPHEPDRGGPATEPTSGGVGEELGKVVGSSGEVGAKGTGSSQRPDTGHPLAPGPATLFGPEESPFIDKAGNIRVDNLTSREDVARAIRDAAEANDDFIGDRRGVVTDGQVMELADALGMDFHRLMARKIGDAFNAEQVIAARKLLIQSATQVSELMKKAATGTDADVMAYAQAKDRHQMIQAQVAGITAEAGRALRAFRDIKGTETAQNVDQFLRNATGKTLYQLRQEAQLGMALDTPQQVSKFLKDAQERSFGRMILEYWINGLISGPATHTTYMVGNALLSVWKAGPETAAAALIGKARSALGREGNVVHLGEVKAQLAAGVKALPTALDAAGGAFKTGVSTLLPGETPRTLPFQPQADLITPTVLNENATYRDVMSDVFGTIRGLRDAVIAGGAMLKAGGIEGAPLIGTRYSQLGSIPDIEVKGMNVLPIGSAVRAPGRFIAAIHSFFRAVNYSMSKNGMAYRTAAEEGLEGNAFASRVADLRQNPTPEMMNKAVNEATDLALMGGGGEFMRLVGNLANARVNIPLLGETQILKFVDPFVHIAGNIINQSLVQRTPLGILSAELRADLMGKNGTIAQDMAMARMMVGTGMAIVFGSLAAEGYVTGSGPSDRHEAATWRQAGYQAHSVRIGDVWYDMHRLGPLGMLLGVAADMYEVAHKAQEDDLSEAASHFVHALTQNVLDESFVRGPAELIKAVEDSDRSGPQYIRNFLSSFVPYSVGMAQVARASDPYSRQARSVMDAIKAKIPGLSEELLPRRDIWGEPIPNRDVLGPKGLSAIYAQQISKDPVNIAMLDLGVNASPLPRKIRNVDLTDQQYDDFSRIAGRMAKQRLDAIVNSPDWRTWPPHEQRYVIEEVIKQSRESARGMVLMKYPQVMRDATEERLAKFRD